MRFRPHFRLRAALTLFALAAALAGQQRYQANWPSIDSRPTPAWFDAAKFGIFIHWGVYSVPAFADPHAAIGETYAEWYWNHLHDNGATRQFHLRTYGENFRYEDFAPLFRAELFEPDRWADLFARAGARYVVLTSKHHDGFALWPSAQSWNWNAVDAGPHRDLAGDIAQAVRRHGLRMGFYYSLYEWYNPIYHSDPERYVRDHVIAQIHDLVERYRPSLLWGDGEWDHPSDFWHSPEFLAWLLNDSPVRDEVAINDRWGKDTRGLHGGFYTSEYGKVHLSTDQQLSAAHKWEECQGIGKSFGYNRAEALEDYKSAQELIHMLIEIVARGGNLLLDIGPAADGRVPVIMQQRLLEIGDWLRVNGEAIYSTRPWRRPDDGENVRYTARDKTVYALLLAWPDGGDLVLKALRTGAVTATLLGHAGDLPVRAESGVTHVKLPALAPDKLPARYAWVVKLDGVQ